LNYIATYHCVPVSYVQLRKKAMHSCMQYTRTKIYNRYIQWHTAATTTELRLTTKGNSYNIGKTDGQQRVQCRKHDVTMKGKLQEEKLYNLGY